MLPKCTLYPTAMQHAVLIAKAIGSHGRMNSCMWKVSSKRTQTTNTRSRCRWTMSHQKEAKAEEESDPVPRNEFGGVYVDEEELRAAFDFFDVQKKGTLVSKRAAVCGLRAAGWNLRRRRRAAAPARPWLQRHPCSRQQSQRGMGASL